MVGRLRSNKEAIESRASDTAGGAARGRLRTLAINPEQSRTSVSLIHSLLGLKKPADSSNEDPRAVQAISTRLQTLPEEEARYLAAFAYVLARTAYADLDVSDKEVEAMHGIVQDHTQLGRDHAVLVVDLATTQARTLGGTQDFVVTKLLGQIATPQQRMEVLECILAVAAADDLIIGEEENEIRLISRQMGISDKVFLEALSRYRDKRSVMKDWPS
jgi:uncharacterized tellurite resistance protein B-like protein